MHAWPKQWIPSQFEQTPLPAARFARWLRFIQARIEAQNAISLMIMRVESLTQLPKIQAARRACGREKSSNN